MKNIAVCLSGQLRTFDRCLPSIKKHILDRIDCDIFAYIAEDVHSGNINLLNTTETIIKPDSFINEYNLINQTGGLGVISIQVILQQINGLYEVNKMKMKYEQQNNKKYDWVIRLRPDMVFSSDMEDLTKCDNNSIYIPCGNDHCGYNDRFAFGNSKNMDIYMNRFSLVNENYKEIIHPESMLKYVLDKNNIKILRSNIDYNTWRLNGQITYM